MSSCMTKLEFLPEPYMIFRLGKLFTPKFGKKNVGTQNFQDCVIKELIRYESVSVDLDTMLELTILQMMSADDVNGLCLNGARKMCRTLQIRKIRVQGIIKLESFFYSKNCNELYWSRIYVQVPSINTRPWLL